jgi:hypothetical protein
LEFLAENIFDFTVYDSEIAETFARRAVEVCTAINESATFEYIKKQTNYEWYLLMCNMPFFVDKLEWGGSIRGAWWRATVVLNGCGLWEGETHLTDPLTFGGDEWERFIAATIEFAAPEMSPKAEIDAPQCKYCGVEMIPRMATGRTWRAGIPDFPGQKRGLTYSPGGPGYPLPCWSCPKCGRQIACDDRAGNTQCSKS